MWLNLLGQLAIGCVLLAYSLVCFLKPRWLLWLSISPILEEKNPLTPFIWATQGVITGLIGLVLVVRFFALLWSKLSP